MLHLFTVRDAKVEAYLQPFFLRSRGEAIRVMTDCVNDRNHLFNKHPEDYNIYYLGTFDEQTGICDILDQPEHILPVVELQNLVEDIQTTVEQFDA